jgi:hypothetical protein
VAVWLRISIQMVTKLLTEMTDVPTMLPRLNRVSVGAAFLTPTQTTTVHQIAMMAVPTMLQRRTLGFVGAGLLTRIRMLMKLLTVLTTAPTFTIPIRQIQIMTA